MELSSEPKEQEVATFSEDDLLITKSVHYTRLQTWLWLTFSTVVVLTAIYDAVYSPTEVVNWASSIVYLISSSLTLAISATFTVLIALALVKQKWSFLPDLENLGGSFSESFSIWSCVLLTSVTLVTGLGIIKPDSVEIEFNANLFHGCWIGFGCAIRLRCQFHKEYRDFDLIKAIQSGGTRCLKWCILLLSSAIVMVASVTWFIETKCKSKKYNLPQSSIIFEIDPAVFCRRTGVGVGVGTCSTFLTIMILWNMKYASDSSKELLLLGESLFSFVSVLLNVGSLFFITSISGPATSINSLYVASWLSFIVSVQLIMSCIIDLLSWWKERETGQWPIR